jgi:Protein of unknown function (DUF1501)
MSPDPSRPPAWEGLLNRRDVLRLGGLGVAGALLPAPLRAAPERRPGATARSVIVLWMAGGVTHIDSFDPKPDAPAEVRGTLRAIQTPLPGVRFSEVMPHLAAQLRHLAVVRSFAHDSNDHFISQAHVLSGVTGHQVCRGNPDTEFVAKSGHRVGHGNPDRVGRRAPGVGRSWRRGHPRPMLILRSC